MRSALRRAARRALHRRRLCAALLRLLPRLLTAVCLLAPPLLRGTSAALPAAGLSLAAVCFLLPLLEAVRCRWLCGRLIGCPLRLRRRQFACVYGTALCRFWLRAGSLLAAALPAGTLFLAIRLRLRHGGASQLSLWIDWCGLAALTLAGLAFFLPELQRSAAALPLALTQPGLSPRQAVILSRRRTAQAGGALLRASLLRFNSPTGEAQFLLLLLTDYAF